MSTSTISGSTAGTSYNAYASASDVAGYCRNLLGSQANFTASTCPTLAQVNQWISSGCGTLEVQLSSYGYDVPFASGTRIYDELRDLNSLFAAARAEMSRSNVVLSPGERTRGQVFDEMFWKGMDRLKGRDLSLAGATRSTSGKLYVGGISDADKSTVVSDTDRTTPRFARGMFDTPGILQPAEGTSGS